MTTEAERPGARRILIVDDDLPLLDALDRAFKRAGENVFVRDNFEDARDLIKRERFDVLLTDVRLGAFNGLQLAVLARDINPETQLIVFSGFDDPVLRKDSEALGAVYVVKPVSSSDLLRLIREPRR